MACALALALAFALAFALGVLAFALAFALAWPSITIGSLRSLHHAPKVLGKIWL